MLPIENSLGGTIHENLDLLMRYQCVLLAGIAKLTFRSFGIFLESHHVFGL